MSFALICRVIALVFFVLAAFYSPPVPVNLQSIGLAFLTLSFMVP